MQPILVGLRRAYFSIDNKSELHLNRTEYMERNKELPHICTELDRNQSAKVTEQHWETERSGASREAAVAMTCPSTPTPKTESTSGSGRIASWRATGASARFISGVECISLSFGTTIFCRFFSQENIWSTRNPSNQKLFKQKS
jgi:hypothetical protein